MKRLQAHHHPANRRRYDDRRVGERLADEVTLRFGSWTIILAQSVIVCVDWIEHGGRHAKVGSLSVHLVEPSVLTQAAYAAPLLLLSQNRQAERDRVKAEHDYGVNRLALQYLIAWHADTHHPDVCLRQPIRA